jgi:hypothetical protein
MEVPDQRLIERALRRGGLSAGQLEEALGSMPDLSERIRAASEAELQALRDELIAEHSARSQRVQRQLTEDRSARRKPGAVVPIPESEL